MKRKTKMTKARKKEVLAGYLFISPWIVGFLFLIIGPMIMAIYFSFCSYDIINPPKWIGLANYKRAFFQDSLVWQSIKVTSIYTFVGIPLGMILSFSVALLMNQKVRFLGFFRTIFYLPTVVSGVAVSLLWIWILQPNVGLLNMTLSKLGIMGPNWLDSTRWALPSLIFMSLWGVGGPMLIYLAALQGVPTSLYESADIDGASSFYKLIRITIPMVSPAIFYNLIMSIIGSFQTFIQGYIMTQGGPRYSTLFYILYLYNNAFYWFRMGYASTLAWILFIIVVLLTMLVIKSSSVWLFYEGSAKGGKF